MRCQCGELMKKGKREDISDGEYWRCPVCETNKFICGNTLFKISTHCSLLCLTIICYKICDGVCERVDNI